MRSAVVLLLGAVGIAAVAHCSTPESTRGKGGPNSGSFDRQALLSAFGECALGTYKTFQTAAVDLDAAAAKAASDPSEANRNAVKEAWKRAIDAWQVAELFAWGPAAAASTPGGKGLRDEIYSWPLVSSCLVDELVAKKSYEDSTMLVLANTRSLTAAERLFFYAGAENACAATHGINSSGAWAALSPDELRSRRAKYGAVVTADLVVRANALVDAWDPAKGNFLGAFRSAGKGSTVYATEQAAFNAVSDALFYLEKVTKDRKLGALVGLGPDCKDASCPALLESKFAQRSKEHVKNNLLGFRKLLKGCGADHGGLGWDDFLAAASAGNLATRMDADVVAAIAAIDAMPYATFDEALAKDPASVRKIYDAVKKVTDALKTEFVSILALELPKHVEGDND